MKDYKKLYKQEKKKVRELLSFECHMSEVIADLCSYVEEYQAVKLKGRIELWRDDTRKLSHYKTTHSKG